MQGSKTLPYSLHKNKLVQHFADCQQRRLEKVLPYLPVGDRESIQLLNETHRVTGSALSHNILRELRTFRHPAHGQAIDVILFASKWSSWKGIRNRALKEAIFCHPIEHWPDTLPMIWLGFRTLFKKEIRASPAELVYWTNLRIPVEFLEESKKNKCDADFVNQLRKSMKSLRPYKL